MMAPRATGALTTTWPQPGRALLLLAVDGVLLQAELPAETMNEADQLRAQLDHMRQQLLRAIARGRGRQARQ